MDKFGEKILKMSEVCATLNVSDYERKQLIAAGILEPPIEIGAAYPKHTLSQVLRAQSRIAEKARPRPLVSGRRTIKPLSKKMIAAIRNSGSR